MGRTKKDKGNGSDPSVGVASTPTDQTTSEAQSAAAPLTVNAQYLKDFSFENPNPLKAFQSLQANPEISITVDIQATPVQEKVFEVALKLKAVAKQKDLSLYVTEVDYAGIFTLGNVTEESVYPILMIECPRLLFPFARAVISEATREGGFPPLSIAPIDFVGLYNQQVSQNAAGQKASSTASA